MGNQSYSFKNDYSEGAHPSIMEALLAENFGQHDGYGMDEHCTHARKLIQKRLGNEEVEIHFLPGGTITNLTFISHILKPYQAVIAAETGHINVHETGAIEATGHKVLAIPAADGKLTPALIEPLLRQHEDEHWVMPAMVYLSDTTEIGTVYTKAELEALHSFCKQQGLFLYLDGARLSMALAVTETGLAFSDLAKLTDAFYIGGTKVGALFGEALVLVHDTFKAGMRHNMKQHGAMLAKGWLLGIQFEALFREDLYLTLGRHANAMALRIKAGIEKAGFSFASDSCTNQLFPIFPNEMSCRLQDKYEVLVWSRPDGEHTSLRFCTSWATREESVSELLQDISKMQ